MSYASLKKVSELSGLTEDQIGVGKFNLFASQVDSFIEEEINSTFEDVAETTRSYFAEEVNLFIDPVRDVTEIKFEDHDAYDLEDDVILLPINESVKSWIVLKGYERPFPGGWVTVTGKFSLATCAPNDIVDLASFLVSKDLDLNSIGNLASENIEGYSRSYKFTDYKNEDLTQKILKKYKVEKPS